MKKEIALVTGTSRGIGHGIALALAAKGYIVLASARDLDKAIQTVSEIEKTGAEAWPIELDVSKESDIEKMSLFIQEKYGRLDILINNAGVYDHDHPSILTIPESAFINVLKTNSFAPLKLIQRLHPLLAKSENPRIINISSGMGSMNDMGQGSPAYRLSKTVLNVFTILLGQELKSSHIRVNSVCPGWVRTDMGGENAPRSVEEAVSGIIKLIQTPKNGPTGGFFRDGEQIEW